MSRDIFKKNEVQHKRINSCFYAEISFFYLITNLNGNENISDKLFSTSLVWLPKKKISYYLHFKKTSFLPHAAFFVWFYYFFHLCSLPSFVWFPISSMLQVKFSYKIICALTNWLIRINNYWPIGISIANLLVFLTFWLDFL